MHVDQTELHLQSASYQQVPQMSRSLQQEIGDTQEASAASVMRGDGPEELGIAVVGTADQVFLPATPLLHRHDHAPGRLADVQHVLSARRADQHRRLAHHGEDPVGTLLAAVLPYHERRVDNHDVHTACERKYGVLRLLLAARIEGLGERIAHGSVLAGAEAYRVGGAHVDEALHAAFRRKLRQPPRSLRIHLPVYLIIGAGLRSHRSHMYHPAAAGHQRPHGLHILEIGLRDLQSIRGRSAVFPAPAQRCHHRISLMQQPFHYIRGKHPVGAGHEHGPVPFHVSLFRFSPRSGSSGKT